MKGWIKLHRKMVEWEWYEDSNTLRVFLHLLLIANHKDGSVRGIPVKRGQALTGRRKLADSLKLSEKQIRTALNHLRRTNEVATDGANTHSIITIINYDTYQCVDVDEGQLEGQPDVSTGANEGPTRGQRGATNKNDKKEKNEKKETQYTPEFESFWKTYPARNGRRTGKKDAFTEFKIAVQKVGMDRIMSAVKLQATTSDWKKDNGKYIPEAHRWLKKERWTDEVETKPESAYPYKPFEEE
jgi:hypothetical protein